jgi:uncharacterized protein
VTTDDLSVPLGQSKTGKRSHVLTITLPHALAGILSIFIAVFAGWAIFVRDPFGGEPLAVVHADFGQVRVGKASAGKGEVLANTAANQRSERSLAPAIEIARPSSPPMQTITIIDGTSGKRQEIEIPMPQESADAQSADEQTGSLDRAEEGAAKSLPKVATDGPRQSDANLRPVKAATGKPGAPRR